MLKKIFLILLITFLYFINSFSQTDNAKSLTDNPTQIKKYVVDETNTLTPEQVNALLKKLVDFEKQTSNQIIIYIIESLNGEPIENAAYKIASANKIGKKDKNNGVLFLIAIKDKKMRIEVGYGLEGALTDAISSSILRNEVTPSFREGKYFEGVSKGLDAIMLATKNEYKNTDKNTDKNSNQNYLCFGIPVFIFIMFGFIFFFIFISIIQRIFGFGRKFTSGTGTGSGFWGGWGSGSSSGSSGGFGGFSGGGGSFGGGGASGGW